jgi:hypothetical protein
MDLGIQCYYDNWFGCCYGVRVRGWLDWRIIFLWCYDINRLVIFWSWLSYIIK